MTLNVLPWETPPNFLSTMKAVTLSVLTPVFGSSTGVWAKTVKTSAMPPFEIQIFDPLRIQVFPSGPSSALVLIDPASDPEEGSVRAKAANCSPDARGGRYFDFCSGVPKRVIPEKMDSKYVNASKHQWVITYQLFVQLLTLLYSSLVKVIQISNPKYYRLVASSWIPWTIFYLLCILKFSLRLLFLK